MCANQARKKPFVGYVHVNEQEWSRIARELRGFAMQITGEMKGIDTNGLMARLNAGVRMDSCLKVLAEELTRLHNEGRVSCDNTGMLVNVKDWGIVLGEMLAITQYATETRRQFPRLVKDSTNLTTTLSWMYEDLAQALLDMAIDVDAHILNAKGESQ